MEEIPLPVYAKPFLKELCEFEIEAAQEDGEEEAIPGWAARLEDVEAGTVGEEALHSLLHRVSSQIETYQQARGLSADELREAAAMKDFLEWGAQTLGVDAKTFASGF